MDFIDAIPSYCHALICSNAEDQLGTLQTKTVLPQTLCIHCHCCSDNHRALELGHPTDVAQSQGNVPFDPSLMMSSSHGQLSAQVFIHNSVLQDQHNREIQTLKGKWGNKNGVGLGRCLDGNRGYSSYCLGLMSDSQKLPKAIHGFISEAWNPTSDNQALVRDERCYELLH